MTVLAVIGAKGLYLLFAWLISGAAAAWVAERKGYGERFGVMHVDFETQERTPKASARWLSELARTGRIPAPRP